MNQASTRYYAGIGPRDIPRHIQEIMTTFAKQMFINGFVLRSGNARGADQAFQLGCPPGDGRQIYLPWNGHENQYQNGLDIAVNVPSVRMAEIAKQHHPAWDHKKRDGSPVVSHTAKLLLIRNVPIILGECLNEPAEAVITWYPPRYSGGTMHAVRIAQSYNIPVHNLYDYEIEDDEQLWAEARLEALGISNN